MQINYLILSCLLRVLLAFLWIQDYCLQFPSFLIYETKFTKFVPVLALSAATKDYF